MSLKKDQMQDALNNRTKRGLVSQIKSNIDSPEPNDKKVLTTNRTKGQMSLTLPFELIEKLKVLKKKGHSLPIFYEEVIGSALRDFESKNGKLTPSEILLPSEK